MGFIKKIKSSRSVSSRSTSKQKSRRLSKSMPAKLAPEPLAVEDGGDDAERGSGGRSFSCVSLATGSFSATGVFSITANPFGRSPSPHSNSTESVGSFSDDGEEHHSLDDEEGDKPHLHQSLRDVAASRLSPIREVIVASMPSRVFIRTADLPHMREMSIQSRHSSFSDIADEDLVDHLHRPSSSPPLPTMEEDPNESWVALDDGNGKKSPLAEAAMAALVKTGLDASMDQGMWTPNGGTAKLLKSGLWDDTLFVPCESARPVPVPHEKGSRGEKDVLVWSGTWGHKYYGHDLPAIRCEAIVNMSPHSLASLLMDSERVKEYNKMSIGRDDILVLQEDDKVITKVSIGRSKPPMLGKTLMLKSLLHMEELPGGGEGGGYIIASRAVAHADDAEAAEDPKVIHSEMLMGLNVIRAVEGEPDRCLLINLNHLRSPMIPMMMAKRLGLSAAVNFINDIRALC